LLSPSGADLPDPIGQEESVYRSCAEQIWQDLEAFVEEMTRSESRPAGPSLAV